MKEILSIVGSPKGLSGTR